MKVLHIGKYFPPYAGGMEHYLRDLMTAQARQGVECSALVHQSAIGLTSQRENFPAGEQKLPITRAAVWARALFTPISPTFPWLLSRLIRQSRPDILHLHMPNVSIFWALLLPGARRIPWVVHWHADVLASRHSLGLRLFYRLYRPFERAVLRRCKAVIATSPPYLDSSGPLRNYRDKCHVIPLGLDPASLHKGEPVNDPGGPLRVLAIGRLTYYKGFEYLIEAAAECANIEIHLVGEGEQEQKLKALVRQRQLENRVTFHGHLPDAELARQFAACDCLCLPSIERTEAFGMVLLEAMYHGKATLVSDVPGSGMGWVVDDGVTGLHVPPGDVGALANALIYFENNREKSRIMGMAGRQQFDQRFHIERPASRTTSLYRRLLGAANNTQEN